MSRRRLLGLGLGLVAGCGTTSGAPPAAPATTRRITHEFGTFDIPLRPQRLVALEGRSDLEVVLALGLAPIAVGENGFQDGEPAPWLGWDPADVTIIGQGNDVNLEQLAALRPDVFVARDNNFQDIAEELATIAPLVPVDSGRRPWPDELRRIGGWFGRDQQAEAAIAAYEGERAEIRRRHGARLAGSAVAVVQPREDGQWISARTVGSNRMQVNTLADLGGRHLPFLEQLPTTAGSGGTEFSAERVDALAPAEAILVVEQPGRGSLATAESNPLWSRLPAVTAGRVVVADWRTNQGNVYAARECLRLLDRLYATLP